MNYVHFSPYFPPNYIHFSRALQEAGARVLGLGDMPYDDLPADLRRWMTEYFKVSDLHNYDELVRAMGYFTHRYGKLNGIDAHNEYWLETEARLRTDFNIEGIRVNDLAKIKLKSEMKKVFQSAGLNVARGRVMYAKAEVMDFISEVGYPVVAKPDSGVGAARTYKLCNENDVDSFFADQPATPYIFEEFIEGTIFSFDGLVDKQGRLMYWNAMQNERGVMETVNEDTHIYIMTLRDIPEDLEQAGRKVVEAFGLKGRFFHFEFFREKGTNRLIALEVNMRPPGGFTTDMWDFASDIDIYRIWANMVVHNQNELSFERKYHVCFVGRKNKFTYKHDTKAILEAFGPAVVFHGPLDPALSKAMGNYCYLVRHEDKEKVLEMQRFIHEFDK
ncbi:MAG: ATP-grasp domain-containing protein [Bacteroidetes bacterium]|nr:ATP-grasp domain-containing protein [Bacteroidota bacterium]